MLRLFSRLFPARRPTQSNRYRLAFEQLEDRRLLSAAPALSAVQTQALTNPTTDGTGATLQYIAAGNYQTVTAETLTVAAPQTGLFQLNFQAQAWSGLANRIGVRYLIDSQFDPNDAVIRSGTAADAIEDVGSGAWQTLYLSRLTDLSAGTHTIVVQVYCTNGDLIPADGLAIYSPVLSLTAVNTVNSVAAAVGTQVQALASPDAGSSNTQTVTNGAGWTTVTAATVNITAAQTGLVDLNFQAIADATLTTRIQVQYLIDGNPDPRDQSLGSNGTGADVTEDFDEGQSGQWHTLLLSRDVALGTGTHTISIQIMSTTLTSSASNLTVYTPVLSLLAYNSIAGQAAASVAQSQALASPAAGAPGQQDVTAGSWQTVATLTVPVTASNSGVYALSFQAQAESNGPNTGYVQYLIDGNVDRSDVAITQSASEADTAVDYVDGFGAGTWHTLSLLHLIDLSPGTHTISVQVWAKQQATTGSADLIVSTPVLSAVSYNNVNPTGGSTGGSTGGGTTTTNPGFNYNPSTGLLVINATAASNQFRFSQQSQLNAAGTLTTAYTFMLNNVTETFTSAQLTQVIVNGRVGGTNIATLMANDTYVGSTGQTQQTVENALLGPGGGILQEASATGIVFNFLQLTHFSRINAYMGYADGVQFTDSTGNDVFDSAGLTCYMSGPGYYNYEAGAGNVTATSSNGGHDVAYQYDGSGASTYTATGVTSSVMTGTDQGKTFTNTALGFKFTYGIARHKGDVANLYDAPTNCVFVGMATDSYMYAYAGTVETMDNVVSGFSHVNAFATAGGNDVAINDDPGINTVTGFRKVTVG